MKPMPWSHDDIRKARSVLLAPLLIARGYRLKPLANGNYQIVPQDASSADLAGLVIKNHFWIWADRNIAGNAIDFFVMVLGMTFNQAMRVITAAPQYVQTSANYYDSIGNQSRQTTETTRHNPENPTVAVRQELR